jgi:hypothetical protein
MTKHVLRALAVIGTATLAAGLTASPAGAADTATTFELTAGGLAISAPKTADLGEAAVGSAAVSGKLGPVTVTDDRGALVAAWTATVSSTDFTTGSATPGETVPKRNLLYTPGLPTASNPTVGAFVPTAGALGLPLPVYVAATTGNNFATWNPTVTITLPAQAVAGTYTGTITHSVS